MINSIMSETIPYDQITYYEDKLIDNFLLLT